MENELKRNYLLNLLRITPQLVSNNLMHNKAKFNFRSVFFDLKESIDLFLKKDSDNRFYILPGLRGVGKTTIIFQLYDYLINNQNIDLNRILYLDLDRLKDQGLLNLLDYLDIFIKDINEEAYLNNEPLFIFIDESQYSSNWDHVGKIIFDEYKNVFIIFTGSDALNLQSSMDSARRSLKKEIYPLNFAEYLNLKYDCKISNRISDSIFDTIFKNDIESLRKNEKDIQLNVYNKFKRDISKIWEEYIQYGGFPSSFNRNNNSIIQLTLDMKNRIIEKDLDTLSSFTSQTRRNTYSLINILALQKPGELSLHKLAKNMDISKKSIDNLLTALESTQIIFHIEPYGSIAKRNRKPWKYYFLASQMKAAIYQSSAQASRNSGEYMGILSENLVASLLFMMKNKRKQDFGIFYDEEKKTADFLINTIIGEIIPIEVAYGKKNKRQIKNSMNKYNCEYGIVVSNKTQSIVKDDDVIFLPLKTFSML